ncbi:MAG: ribosome maturation factor RimP [Rhodospirillaceae bacterium]|nr:ribosome maturation factor RimP [Rhodospirillaceae bacterium]|tara:strand:+ start:14797 stop:15348 length:552 start_codon:yes stop_codon:yes gene_type:complete
MKTQRKGHVKLVKVGYRERKVVELVSHQIEEMGFNLVRVFFVDDGQKKLQIMIERANGFLITVDDCADVSKMISALLDVENPIAGAYVLEVSSPGIDRPLMCEEDFDRYSGFLVNIELDTEIFGQRRYIGKLVGVECGDIKMVCNDEDVRLPFSSVWSASLVLTDELIEATQSAWKAAAENEG